MSTEPKIHIVRTNIEESLEAFTARVRVSPDASWRCIYSKITTETSIEASNKMAVLQFLRESFFEADQVEVFWIPTGHLFVFFQGHVTASIRGFEEFLEQIKGDNAGSRKQYQFFWDLDSFWGYFDEALSANVESKSQEVFTTDRKSRIKPLLLILEDDRTTRHFLQAMMQEFCDIIVAWNAQQADEIYKKHMPDIAFLDVHVPYGNGEDLAIDLRKYDKDAFIVMVSGALTPARQKRCFEAGVKGCVAKPPEQNELLKYLNHFKHIKATKR